MDHISDRELMSLTIRLRNCPQVILSGISNQKIQTDMKLSAKSQNIPGIRNKPELDQRDTPTCYYISSTG